jgi:nitrogen-specific signal transduction histidine kinase
MMATRVTGPLRMETDGNGPGLPLSCGIIEEHHGSIEVESEPWHGTTCRTASANDKDDHK